MFPMEAVILFWDIHRHGNPLLQEQNSQRCWRTLHHRLTLPHETEQHGLLEVRARLRMGPRRAELRACEGPSVHRRLRALPNTSRPPEPRIWGGQPLLTCLGHLGACDRSWSPETWNDRLVSCVQGGAALEDVGKVSVSIGLEKLNLKLIFQ